MGYLFDESKFINSNVFQYESRIASQYSRFLGSSPTYVTYYRVNNIESTTDLGFLNVDQVLGKSSPLRFNRVDNLPIYGIEQIVPELDMGEEGMNVDFSGTGILLPNTVIPRPNDFFLIQYLGKSIIFMVTDFKYDTIRSNNYYEINFMLKNINEEKWKQLERQTVDYFTCYVDNIGTEDKVLIRNSDVDTLAELNEVATKIANFYKILFYDKRYNSFLFNQHDSNRLYDRLLTRFVINNNIFAGAKGYETLYLTEEDPSYNIAFEYHNSIYRAIEEARRDLVRPVKYMPSFINQISSVFFFWRDKKIRTTAFDVGTLDYIRAELIDLLANADKYYVNDVVEDKAGENPILNITIPTEDEKKFVTMNAGYYLPKDEEKLEEIIEEDLTPPVVKPSTDEGLAINFNELMGTLEETISNDVEPPPQPLPNQSNIVISKPSPEVIPEPEPEEEITFEKDIHDKPTIRTPICHPIPEGENIMTRTIVMYMSGTNKSLHSLDLDGLKSYVDFMTPNHETFVMTPILLYVLKGFYKKYVSA